MFLTVIARRILVVLGLMLVAPGCTLLQNSTRTLLLEPLHYCNYLQEHRARAEFRVMARDVWIEVVEANSDQFYSPTYAEGFEDGYSDYLFAGGTGEPPPVPPRKYWKNKYATPEGRQMIEDWYAGFRHGATTAEASGCRYVVTVPSSLPTSPPVHWGDYGDPGRTFEVVPAPAAPAQAAPGVSTSDATPEAHSGNSLATWSAPAQGPTRELQTSFYRGTGMARESSLPDATAESRIPKQLELDERAVSAIASQPVRLPAVLK